MRCLWQSYNKFAVIKISSKCRRLRENFCLRLLEKSVFAVKGYYKTVANMCAKMAFQHQAGTVMECLSIPITLHKECDGDVMRCGFKIGGGIDQDYHKSPQGYTDNGIYVTEVHDSSPASRSGLRVHDKILQCNGYDFTMVTHKKAVSYIRKHPVLNLLVARKGVTST